MRGADPRAAAILSRCDAMSDTGLERLHGARRPGENGARRGGYGEADDGVPVDGVPVYGCSLPEAAAEDEDDVPWWDAGKDARAQPTTDAVLVAGVAVAKGSRVLLRPSRRADAQDLFLAGMTAVVTRVYFDVDGGTHLAVVLEDDPASDLYGATGRFYYFGPEEIEPLPARTTAGGAG